MNTEDNITELAKSILSIPREVSDDLAETADDNIGSPPSDEPIIEEPAVCKEPVYGPTDDGEYLTPYQTTVVYNPESLFETTLAGLTNRAQRVPLSTGCTNVVELCEHISPEVLVFNDLLSIAEIGKFFERGFQVVHVFNTTNSPGLECEDTRIAQFDVSTMYDHLCLAPGMAQYIVVELMTCLEFPDYKSNLGSSSANATRGRNFARGLKLNTRDTCNYLFEMSDSPMGFDRIEALISAGETVYKVGQTIADERLADGVVFESSFSVDCDVESDTVSAVESDVENDNVSAVESDTASDAASDVENDTVSDTVSDTASGVESDTDDSSEGVNVVGSELSESTPPTKHVVYAVRGGEFDNDIIDRADKYPRVAESKADYLLLYHMDTMMLGGDNDFDLAGALELTNSVQVPGWTLTLVSLGDVSDPDCPFLRKISPRVFTGWLPSNKCKNILPHIYA